MSNTGLRFSAKLRRAWPLALFAAGAGLLIAGAALVSVPAALIVAGFLALAVTAAEVF